MQDLAGWTAAELRAKVTDTRHKFEVYVDGAWVNLCAMPSQRTDVLAGWSHRWPIYIKPDYIDGTLTDFPVLVKFTGDTDIGATCDFQGDDIRFTAADGTTLLKFERETFSVTSGAASGEFWVKIPSLTTAGARIYLYWGNDDAANGEDASAVWDSSYKGVWHMWDMNEASTVLDSTGNDNDGTKHGSTQAAGKVGYGQDFDGANDYLSVTGVGSLSALTAEAWVKLDDLTALSEILRASGEPYPTIRIQNDTLILKLDAWDATGYASTAITGDGAWKHVAATWDSTAQTIKLYIDGALAATVTGIDTTAQDLSWPAVMGSDPAAENYTNGLIDEVRVSSSARSASWLKFEYRNVSETDNCLEWGTPQTLTENRLKTIFCSPSGAGRGPEPVSGQWSATFDNSDGIFHPFHPTSAYAEYFRIGREVRISVGVEDAGTVTWWQRMQGFMDEPKVGATEISVSGADYMKLLADTQLRSPWTHWGTHEHFTSVATGGTGTELYDEGDACEVTTDADNVTPWTVGASGGAVASVAGQSSTFALEFSRDVVGPTEQYAHDSNIFTLVADKSYIVQFDGAITAGTNYARIIAYETVGGAATYLGEATIPYVEGGDDASFQIIFKAKTASALQLRVSTGGKYATAEDSVRIDNISVKTWDPADWYKYPLAAVCTGVYAVTLDGEFVAHGDEDALRGTSGQAIGSSGGWHYDADANEMRFSEQMQIAAGLDVVVYYFTAQALDDVAADLLVASNIYSSRALAKADWDCVAPGISLDRVWFKEIGDKTSISAREAMKLLCERANYRFWFSPLNTPTFRPAATLKATPDFTFSEVSDVATPGLEQDLAAVKNRVVIIGEEQSVEPGTSEKPTALTGEASDSTYIDENNEKTWTIKNQLFQDVASIAEKCAEYLAEFAPPRWYTNVPVPFCAVPFEPGDSVTLQVPITPALSVEKKAIVRGVTFDLSGSNLKCEVAEGYPVVPKTPDIGAHENQKGTTPVTVALPDIGAHENQGA